MIIKQKTLDDGTTLQLRRAKTEAPGKQYEYFVTEQGGGPIGDPVYTKRDGMQEFEETVSAYQNTSSDSGGGPMLPGFGSPTQDDDDAGGGGPVIPGVGGPMADEEDDDDDNDPMLPFY